MAADSPTHLELEIGHVLFMDVVGYSKLLINEQRELQRQLTQIVRSTEHFRAAEAAGIIAQRIVAARPFKSAGDLRSVKGIGDKKYAKIRPSFS